MRRRRLLNNICWICACLIISVVFIVPLYYAIVNSMRSIYSQGTLFVKKPSFENYVYAITLIPFWRYFRSSVIIVVIRLVFGLTVEFIYAYAFARLKARGKNLLFVLVLSQMMIPGFALQIPRYLIFSALSMKNSYWLFVINAIVGSAYDIFLFRQYIKHIPTEIEEAAVVDGCGYFRMIYSIFVPLCKPVIAVVFFGIFINSWGDYMTPFMYLSESKYPLAVALFGDTYSSSAWTGVDISPITLAAALLFAIPNVIVFFACQKRLVEGLTAGGVKG